MNLACKFVRGSMWDLAAGALTDAARTALLEHVEACPDCLRHQLEAKSLRSGLSHLPMRAVPSLLNTRLRVLASRERQRAELRRDWKGRLRESSWGLIQLFDNLLKPFAVPAAGGLLASVLCFGIIVDSLQVSRDIGYDIPVGLYTEVMIDELTPFGFHGHDVMLQLTVDSQGKVTDFEVMQAEGSSLDEVRDIGNLVMFSTFTPATRFGQRVSSKMLFAIRHVSAKT